MRRHYVTLTLVCRRFDVMCSLGIFSFVFQAKVTEGWIGDRKLKLRSKSSYGGSTVLDIIDFNYKKTNPGKPFIDRIIYSDKD